MFHFGNFKILKYQEQMVTVKKGVFNWRFRTKSWIQRRWKSFL